MNKSFILNVLGKDVFIITHIEERDEWAFSTVEKMEVRNPKTGEVSQKRVRYPRVKTKKLCLEYALQFGERKGWWFIDELKAEDIKESEPQKKYYRSKKFNRPELISHLLGDED